ncbi:MAG: site-specific DNA-methyltransferase [Muribaculaceae bacterium]|nr:site-specific DNA-methyltransferase [Muribaculaceae bacterium]
MTDVIINLDCLDALRQFPDDSINCCVTSPPYYALRDYGMQGQIGREETPELYINRLTEVFREVRRVLAPNGTLWLNIADTYAGKGNQGNCIDPKYPSGRTGQSKALNNKVEGCKPKDMIGIPWKLAFALRDDGWYLRSDIIWHKANPMPESVRDRPSRCYEHIFLLSKSRRYFYDADAISEPVKESSIRRMKGAVGEHTKHNDTPIAGVQNLYRPRSAGTFSEEDIPKTRNRRDVWQINTFPFKGSHFAAFPPKLAETCILAGCPEGGVVLDPFFGSGTTGLAAKKLGRQYIGIELNPEYCKLAEKRIRGEFE